jgi:protein-S-isoprenylcysteine O-methyltransferase Ste14
LLARYGLPLLLVVIGVVLIVIGHGHYTNIANRRSLESAAGVSLLLIALAIWLINWMMRMSVDSTRDREKEELAREEFTRTGRWPDEDG